MNCCDSVKSSARDLNVSVVRVVFSALLMERECE